MALPFALGSLCIVQPAVGIPVAGFVGAVQGLRKLRSRGVASGVNPSTIAKAQGEALFQLSDGAPPPVTLVWSDITITLEDAKRKAPKTLLRGVSGAAVPGRLLAIMGPSGSGKTTLLNTLAGQLPVNKAMTLTGDLRVNKVPATESNHRQAYVRQEDVFYSQLTVLETLTMAAELRLPPDMEPGARKAYIDALMSTLGLSKVANTRVGSAKQRGLSGGEKKRLSLGCELVGSPSLLFLDEPTSGLDAAAAEKVMLTLKALAAAGHTVVCSIHQPRSSIWTAFDDLVLLHEGQVVYQGPANQALPHFAALGHVCPAATNPAEFLADLISPDYAPPTSGGDEEGANNGDARDAARLRVARLVEAWQRAPHPLGSPAPSRQFDTEDPGVHAGLGVPPGPLLPWHRQFRLLARRSWRQVIRDKSATVARVMANVSSALLFGMIFWRMGRSQGAIQDRLGLMQVIAINTAMTSLSKTLNVFPRERLVVNRERAHHSYGTAPYLAAKLLAELPIGAVFPLIFGTLVYPMCGLHAKARRLTSFLSIVTLASFASSAFGLMVGAFSPSTEAALAIGPASMTLWIVFGGYYVNAENVPRLLKWLPKASLIKQAFAALVINEMSGLRFQPDAQGRGMVDGQQVLDWLSFGKTSVRDAMVQQLRITAFYYWAAYAILSAAKPRFQPLLPPRPVPADTADDADSAAASGDAVQMKPLPPTTAIAAAK